MKRNWTRIARVAIGVATLVGLEFVSVPAESQDVAGSLQDKMRSVPRCGRQGRTS